MQLDRFRILVEEALAHLYEQTFLQTHALALCMVDEPSSQPRGRALQKALLSAIQDLRPPADVPYESIAWRKYRYLYLRYVETLSPSEIAEELAISVRQSTRYWHEGLQAVTSILWDTYGERIPRVQMVAPSGTGPDEEAPDRGLESLPEREAARMGATGTAIATSVEDVIQSALGTIEPLAHDHAQSIAADVPDGLPSLSAERTVIRQAILSLLSLAIEYCEGGAESGPLELRARAMPTGDCVEIVLSVHLSTTTSRHWPPVSVESGSTTIALATAERLVQETRWRVATRLLETQGAKLRVGEDRPGIVDILIHLPATLPVTVLVVEDNPDTVSLFRRYLSGTPYRVVATSDGGEAIRLAIEERPAAITLDVMMPSRDGWEVLQALKSRPDTRQIPVVVCSVLEEHDLARLLGAATLLPKPVSRDRLLATLATVLGQSSADRS